jgi:hypothetical protein
MRTKQRVGLIRTRLFLSVMGALTILPCVLCAQSHPELLQDVKQLSTMGQAQEWFTYYYLHPRPDLLPSALEVFSNAGALKSQEAAGTLVAFLAQVCAANPDKVSSWAAVVGKRPNDQKVVMEAALWIANSVESRLALAQLGNAEGQNQKKAISQMLSQPPPDLLQGEIESPVVVDALWGGFFATGDRRFVERIISVLPWINVKDNASKLLIGEAAQRSLTSNAIQHPRVLEICKDALNRVPENQKSVLAEAIQRAEKAGH